MSQKYYIEVVRDREGNFFESDFCGVFLLKSIIGTSRKN